jgi:predicted metal-dependent phosphoesterase TrpH
MVPKWGEKEFMLIDLHVHTADYSPCSELDLEQAILRAKDMGLQGLCITDHESNGIASKAMQLARKHQFFILVGMEILTRQGDLLVFGLEEMPAGQVEADFLLKKIHQCQGIAISAHPFRDNGRGMGELIRQYPQLSGVEVFNGRTSPNDNYRALHLTRLLRFNAVGGSDAHRLDEVGRYVTAFPDGIRDLQDFREAFLSQQVFPMQFQGHAYEEVGYEKEII